MITELSKLSELQFPGILVILGFLGITSALLRSDNVAALLLPVHVDKESKDSSSASPSNSVYRIILLFSLVVLLLGVTLGAATVFLPLHSGDRSSLPPTTNPTPQGFSPTATLNVLTSSSRVATADMVPTVTPTTSSPNLTLETLATPAPSARGWHPLDGLLSSRPVVVHSVAGLLYVFVRSSDDTLRYIYETAPGKWSDWQGFDGKILGVPAAEVNQNGGIEVFARSADNTLQHRYQTRTNGAWSSWDNLQGNLDGDPIVVSNKDGRLEVFARFSGNVLMHRYQVKPNGEWWDWMPIMHDVVGDPSVMRDSTGRLVVFMRGSDGTLQLAAQKGLNEDFGKQTSLLGSLMGNPAAAHDSKQMLHVFVRWTDDSIYEIRETAPGFWSGWRTIGGTLIHDPDVAQQSDGGLIVLGRGWDGRIWFAEQMTNVGGEDSWSPWHSIIGPVSSDPNSVQYIDGTLLVFVRSIGNALFYTALPSIAVPL